MTDYSLGKIYAIRSPHSNKAYFGSTTQDLNRRFAEHVYDFNTRSEKATSSSEILKLGDAFIQLLMNYPCTSKEELERQEQHFIEYYKDWAINKKAAFSDLHRNDPLEYMRQYNKRRNSVRITCACDGTYLSHM